MRVLLTAKVLICWAKGSVEGAVGKGDEIRDGLRGFIDVGRQNAVHELWLDLAEKVIAGNVGGD